jgi:oligoendopeptidase F
MAGARLRLERQRAAADHTMTTGQERLAADLAVDGLHSWSRLYENMTGRMTFRMDWPDGKVERLPISSYYGLVANVDRRVGKAAFKGALVAWEEQEDILAASLNAIAGFTSTLWKYRHYRDVLEVPLHQTGIKRKTLDAMYRAIRANIELPRAIFREKAKFMGRKGIEWFEREAPLPLRESGLLSWEQGSRMVHDSFLRVYPELGRFYGQMLERRWIESEARAGKRPGAFQTASYITGEPRIYMVYQGTMTDVATLAHEVGHAWHDHLLRDTRVFARRYPTTMGETASVFAEHLFAEGVYRDPSVPDLQKLMMLDSDLGGAALFLLDITVRFDFERQFYEERQKGEVGALRLREMMANAQRQVMGSALLEGGEHPMLWATKVHFFLTDRAFYNFPYTFGFLLSLAMYERMLDQGESFLRACELFLKRSGSGSVEQVAFDTLGEDITREDFWTRSIKSLAGSVDLYARLLQSEKKAVSGARACGV